MYPIPRRLYDVVRYFLYFASLSCCACVIRFMECDLSNSFQRMACMHHTMTRGRGQAPIQGSGAAPSLERDMDPDPTIIPLVAQVLV